MKWVGTVLCLIGIALSSYNVYPANAVFGALGSSFWMIAGVIQKDHPLTIVEGVAVALYISGLIQWLL